MNTTPDSQRVVPVELLPCPFCASPINLKGDPDSEDDLICFVCSDGEDCKGTGLVTLTQAKNLDTAIAAWNRRAPAPAASPPVAPVVAWEFRTDTENGNWSEWQRCTEKGAQFYRDHSATDGFPIAETRALAVHNEKHPAPLAAAQEGVSCWRLLTPVGPQAWIDGLPPIRDDAEIGAEKRLGWSVELAYSRPPAQTQPASPEDRMDGDRVGPDDVLWVVNDMGELGVKIHGRCFFLYKGESLEYADGTGHDDGTPTLYREVGKREFGETVWPQAWIKAGRSEARYALELVHTPGLSDGEPGDPRYQWAPLPVVAAIDAAQVQKAGWRRSTGSSALTGAQTFGRGSLSACAF